MALTVSFPFEILLLIAATASRHKRWLYCGSAGLVLDGLVLSGLVLDRPLLDGCFGFSHDLSMMLMMLIDIDAVMGYGVIGCVCCNHYKIMRD